MIKVLKVIRIGVLILFLLITTFYLVIVVPPGNTCSMDSEAVAEGAWSEGPAMPTGRSEIAGAVLGDKIYVGGGIRLTGATRAFEFYDPAAGEWEKAAPLPTSLHHFGMAAAGDRIYISGGYEGNSLSKATDAVWAYDPAADTWTAVSAMPDPRAAHVMVEVEGKLYVIGGAGIGSTFIWAYDPATDSWSTPPTLLPAPREHLAAAVVEGKIYTIGGRWNGSNLSLFEIYDPGTNAWQRGADPPTARGGLTAAAVDGRIHVTGGEDFFSSPNCTFAQHEVYDPDGDAWSTMAPLPTPRHGLASVALDGRWYVIGGATKANLQTLISASDEVEIFNTP